MLGSGGTTSCRNQAGTLWLKTDANVPESAVSRIQNQFDPPPCQNVPICNKIKHLLLSVADSPVHDVFQPHSASMPMFGFVRSWVCWDAAKMAAAQTTTQSFTSALQKPSTYFWPHHEILSLNQNNSGKNLKRHGFSADYHINTLQQLSGVFLCVNSSLPGTTPSYCILNQLCAVLISSL